MRGLRRAALVLVGALAVAFTAASAPAQDAPAPSPAPATAGESPAMRFRALDLSAMLEKSHGGNHQVDDIALANRRVQVLRAGGAPIDVTTDADGRIFVPAGAAKDGDTLEFVVPSEGGDRWPAMVATPVRVGSNPPGELGFIAVEDGDSPLEIGKFFQTFTVPDREEGTPTLRVNLIAAVRNLSEKVWLGPKGRMSEGTLRIPVPAGFTLVAAQVSGEDTPAELVARPGGGADVVIRERFYPTALSGKESMVRVVLTGAYEKGGAWDFSFRAPWPIEEFRLNIESGVLWYDATGEIELSDGGENPPMSGRATHGWAASNVAPGAELGVLVREGHRIKTSVLYTLGALAFVVLGAVFLGKALRRGSADAPKVAAARGAHDASGTDDRAARLAEIDEKLRRGEITSFEHAARRRQLTQGLRDAPPAPRAAPAAPDAHRVAAEIEARAATADAETLRRDVATLLALLRGKRR